MTSEPRRLKLALIGLGRLGAIRARILAFQQPHIEFVAACDTKPGADKWAAANLPASVKFFADPEECMRNSGAEAVLISTATATHAPLICLALDLDLVSKILPASFSETPDGKADRIASMSCARSQSRSMLLQLRRSLQRRLPSLI
jgi:hypothetical protein